MCVCERERVSVCVCVWLRRLLRLSMWVGGVRRLLRSKKRYEVCLCLLACVRQIEFLRVCVGGGCLFMCVFVCVCFVCVLLCEWVLRVGVRVRWGVH